MKQLLKQAVRVLNAHLGNLTPVYAHYGVTHRCNMRCRMCDVWKSAAPDSELTASQASLLAENLARAGILTAALGGGEPFVRTDLKDLVFAFSKRDIDVRVLTNGIGLREERIREVIDAGLHHISVSLDTLDPQRQKFLYNNTDVWHEIVHTMRRFRAWLPPDSIPIMNVCVSCLNIGELDQLVEFAAEEGFFTSFVPIALSPSQEESDGFAAVAPELALTDADRQRGVEMYTKLLEMKKEGYPIVNSSRFLRDSQQHLAHGTCPWQCDAGSLYLSISPDGEISICHRFPGFARFDTNDLATRLAHPDNQARFAARRSNCRGCMRPCWTEITHAVHDMFSSLEALRTHRQTRRLARRR